MQLYKRVKFSGKGRSYNVSWRMYSTAVYWRVTVFSNWAFFLSCDANGIDKHSDITLLTLMIMQRRENCGIRKQPSQQYKEGLTRSRYWLVPILCKRRVFFLFFIKKWQVKVKVSLATPYDCSFPSAAHRYMLCTIAKIRIVTWHCGQSACTLSSTVFVFM